MDYYKILGLENTATTEEIKRAYRQLSRASHPDFNKAERADHLFMLIKEAHETLVNPSKRRAYDTEMGFTGNYYADHDDTNQGFSNVRQDEGYYDQRDASDNTYGDAYYKAQETEKNEPKKINCLLWVAGIVGVITGLVMAIETGKITNLLIGFVGGGGSVLTIYLYYLLIKYER